MTHQGNCQHAMRHLQKCPADAKHLSNVSWGPNACWFCWPRRCCLLCPWLCQPAPSSAQRLSVGFERTLQARLTLDLHGTQATPKMKPTCMHVSNMAYPMTLEQTSRNQSSRRTIDGAFNSLVEYKHVVDSIMISYDVVWYFMILNNNIWNVCPENLVPLDVFSNMFEGTETFRPEPQQAISNQHQTLGQRLRQANVHDVGKGSYRGNLRLCASTGHATGVSINHCKASKRLPFDRRKSRH